VCYGTFGFGYIVPATYLPALAREAMAGAIASGLVWPVFGLAGALSTAAAAIALRNVAPRVVWIGTHLVMAAGVAAPAWWPGTVALVFAALAIGGTFMLLTMAAMQEARRVAGRDSTRLIAAMTASFAVGQLAGPVVVGLLASQADALRTASLAAALLLVAGACGLGLMSSSRARMSRTS
jgi:predicted MFS family arabinose efflux permease